MPEFDPDAYLKTAAAPAFDPDAYLGVPAKPTPSIPEAIGRGAVQGATLGTGDEIAGILKSGARSTAAPPKLISATPKQIRAAYPDLPFEEAAARYVHEQGDLGQAQAEAQRQQRSADYKAARDETRAANEAAREAHKGFYIGGELAGSVPAALMAPANALRGASLGQKILLGAKAAIPAGAAAGYGHSTAEDLPGQAADTATGAATAAAVGGALPVLGAALKPILDPLGRTLGSLAERAAVRSAKATGAIRDKVLGASPEKTADVGRFLLDQGVPLRSPQAMKKGLSSILSEEGPQIRSLAEQGAKSGLKVDFQGAAERALDNPSVAELASNTETQPLYDRVANFLRDQFGRHGPEMDTLQAHALRRRLDKLAKYNKTTPDELADAFAAVRNSLNDELGSTMEQAGLGAPWAEANRAYSLATSGSRLARSGVKKSGNELFSLPTNIASAAGAATALATHNPLSALIPIATAAGRKFGMPVAARTADVASKLLTAERGAGPGFLQSGSEDSLRDFLRRQLGLQMTPAMAGAEENQ